ncbi:hypothetical protein DV737_g5770, partial [Chaetothyriales sp. CBS 132003]
MDQNQGQVKLRDTCESCATAKVRCSKDKPQCSRCRTRGLRCAYGTSRRSGRASSSQNTAQKRADQSKSNAPREPALAHDAVNQDEWLASLLASEPSSDPFHCATASHSDSSTVERSFQDSLDYGDPMYSPPFGPGGDIDIVINNDLTTLTGESMGTNRDRHDCLSVGLDLFRRCSIAGSFTPCPRHMSLSGDTLPPNLEIIASLNSHVLEPLSSILDCSCTSNSSLVTIISMILFKVIAHYARAAKSSRVGSAASSDDDGPESQFFMMDVLEASHSTCHSLKDGRCTHGDRQSRAAGRAILQDLYRVQDIVDRFSVQAQTARLQDVQDGSDSTCGQDSSGIQAAISGHLLPLSNTFSVQVLAELRRRLRAVSLEVVQTLLLKPLTHDLVFVMSGQIHRLVPLAKIVGLTSGSMLTAYIASFSVATVPALYAAPISATDIAKQWNYAFELGRSTAPPLAMACASSFAFLAYQSRHIRTSLPVSPSILYAAAAIIAPCIVPYTLSIMGPTISALVAKAEDKANAPSETETKALLQKWSGQNMQRAYITGTATLLSAIAILS